MTKRTRASWLVYVLGALCAGAIVAAILVVGPASGSQTAVTRTATVAQGVVQSTVSGSGNLQAASQLNLGFKTSGTVTHIYVTQGQQVVAGPAAGDARPAERRSHAGTGQGRPAGRRSQPRQRGRNRRRNLDRLRLAARAHGRRHRWPAVTPNADVPQHNLPEQDHSDYDHSEHHHSRAPPRAKSTTTPSATTNERKATGGETQEKVDEEAERGKEREREKEREKERAKMKKKKRSSAPPRAKRTSPPRKRPSRARS